jgi:hypothetical protein
MTSAEGTENRTDEMAGRGSNAGGTPRYTRRLSDKILIAFHQACDQRDLEVARSLLEILGVILIRPPPTPDGNRRRNVESLVAAHERIWHLQHANRQPPDGG